MIAALYVEKNGVYYGLQDVDPWDEERDARLYDGPWPVVAHPPCARWSLMGLCRNMRDGEDGGCFEHALWAVRTFGGVLEHPAHSLAWERFHLPKPARYGWASSITSEGWSSEIDQYVYGHSHFKPTWLYAVGVDPPQLNPSWLGKGKRNLGRRRGWGEEHMRSRTPPAFRDVLLDLARSAARVPAGAQGEKP